MSLSRGDLEAGLTGLLQSATKEECLVLFFSVCDSNSLYKVYDKLLQKDKDNLILDS